MFVLMAAVSVNNARRYGNPIPSAAFLTTEGMMKSAGVSLKKIKNEVNPSKPKGSKLTRYAMASNLPLIQFIGNADK